MSTITKKELVHRIASSTGQTKVVVRDVIQAFLDATIEELAQGNRLEFRDFGVFETKSRAARKAQNPRTLEKVEVPAKRTVRFKPGRLMREQVSDAPEEPDGEGNLGEGNLASGEAPPAADAGRVLRMPGRPTADDGDPGPSGNHHPGS